MEPEKNKSVIKIVERYFRMVIIAFFAAILGWKIMTTSWTIDMSKFDFSALLALLLALFSVGLSVFFYFKATDTSNLFYDNTYKFTKDISEILGRIEAGFGERLRHLDEGYSGLREKFNNGHNAPITQTIEKTTKEIEEEKKKLEQQMKEKEDILEKLMTRAKLQEKEKNEILKSINSKDEHIHNLNRELQFLKRKLEKEETIVDRGFIMRFPLRVIDLLKELIKENFGGEFVIDTPYELVASRFYSRISQSLSERAIDDLKKYGILNDNKHLTEKGYDLLQNIAKRLI